MKTGAPGISRNEASSPSPGSRHRRLSPETLRENLQATTANAAPVLGNQEMQALLRQAGIRPKLEIGGPDDPEEREADATADRVMGTADTACCPQCAGEGSCEDNTLRRQAAADAPSRPALPRAAEPTLRAFRTGGGRLPPELRGFFEPRMGRDFGDVRIHHDAVAGDLARAIGARAFTFGRDIAFAPGQWSPDTAEGRRLIAHELAHTGQKQSAHNIRRQAAPLPAGPSATPAPAAGSSGLTDSGPLRANSDFYVFRDVMMTTDPAFMEGEMRRLIRRHGIFGGDHWFAALQGGGFDVPLPFSAHARAFGGLQVRSPLDAQRDIDNNERGRKLAPVAVPLALSTYPRIRQEAVDYLVKFQAGMATTLETVLRESERRLEAERIRYGLTRRERTWGDVAGAAISLALTGREDTLGPGYEARRTVAFQGLVGAARDLLAIRRRIEVLQGQQQGLMVPFPGGTFLPDTHKPRYDELAGQIATIEQEYGHARTAAALRYPSLGAVLDDESSLSATERLRELASGETLSGPHGLLSNPSGTAGMIGQVIDSRQAAIDRMRKMTGDDPEKLWSIDAIVRLTRVAMDTQGKTMADRLIDDKLDELKFDAQIKGMFLGIVSLALAIPTGGGSLAVATAVAGAAISGYQAFEAIQQYQLQSAMANTDLDRRAYALSAEEPSSFWVALAVVGAVADAAGAVSAFRAVAPEARAALAARRGAEASAAESRLMQAARETAGGERLGQTLLERLARMRGRTPGAAVPGAIGRAEAAAVRNASEAIANEVKAAERVLAIGTHEVKVTQSGHLVICTECTWLRERFVRELADDPALLARVEAAEDKVKLAGKAIDGTTKDEITALTRDLQTAQGARRLAEVGPQQAEALITRHPQLAAELQTAKTLSGNAGSEAMAALLGRAEAISQAEALSVQELNRLLDLPEFAVGTAAGKDFRFVRYRKTGGTLPYDQWEGMAERIWANRGFGTLREKELKDAFDLGPKNQITMASKDPKVPDFIPDHVVGNPTSLEWGKPYHFEEIKDWANMSDTGNLKAMLDYVDRTNGSTLTIYYKSNTYMSGPLRDRIEAMMRSGKVELVPFIGEK